MSQASGVCGEHMADVSRLSAWSAANANSRVADIEGIEHIVEVNAETLDEAVARFGWPSGKQPLTMRLLRQRYRAYHFVISIASLLRRLLADF